MSNPTHPVIDLATDPAPGRTPWSRLPSPLNRGQVASLRRWLREQGYDLNRPTTHLDEQTFQDHENHLPHWDDGNPHDEPSDWFALLTAPNRVSLHHDGDSFPDGYTLIMPAQLPVRSWLRILRRSERDAEEAGDFKPFWAREENTPDHVWMDYLIAEFPLMEGQWYLFSQHHWHEVVIDEEQNNPNGKPSVFVLQQVRQDIHPELFG